MYQEKSVLREKMRRNHSLLTHLSGSYCSRTAQGQGDLRPDLLETPWSHRELKSMLEQDRRECAKHLAETASRPEKFFLAKMIRLGRSCAVTSVSTPVRASCRSQKQKCVLCREIW